MRSVVILIIEICFIIAGIFAINYLVDNLLNPDYTAGWVQGEIGSLSYYKDMYHDRIMRDRQFNRMIFLFMYSFFLVGGYYCAKIARREIKRRGGNCSC